MRIRLTIAVASFMVVLLGWQHVHGGVPARHLLGRIERRREGGQGGTPGALLYHAIRFVWPRLSALAR